MAESKHFDVFISYSRKDYVDDHGNVIPGNEVSKIMSALSEAGISYWFDKEGVIHGEDFGEKILKYIKQSKIFVYLSTSAANESEWTRKEIASAVMYKKKIIPVRIDESPYHDSVMFRIADLDYINYASNPKKSREELVESILRYKAEEQAAAARREAEEQRRREEQERQHKQQEDLRRRQQQADELRAEISRTEEECSELEKTLLLKQHDLGVVNMELESKRKHLEEQKQQMNAILYADEEPDSKKEDNTISPTLQSEDYGFEFQWSHPRESFRLMWQKIKETMHARHWILNVILFLTTLIVLVYTIAGLALAFDEINIGIPLCASMGLSLYALWQLLLNKRSGVGLLLIAPILVLPIFSLSGYDTYYLNFNSLWGKEEYVFFSLGFYLAIAFVLLIFLIRKNGKSAWSLLEGNVCSAFHIQKYVGFYVWFAFMLFLACCSIENLTSKFNSRVQDRIDELRAERDLVIAERDSLHDVLASKEVSLEKQRRKAEEAQRVIENGTVGATNNPNTPKAQEQSDGDHGPRASRNR